MNHMDISLRVVISLPERYQRFRIVPASGWQRGTGGAAESLEYVTDSLVPKGAGQVALLALAGRVPPPPGFPAYWVRGPGPGIQAGAYGDDGK